MSETFDQLIAKAAEKLVDCSTEYKRQYEQLVAFGQYAPNFYWVKDAEGRFLYANPRTIEWLGGESLEDVIGKHDMYFAEKNRALNPDDEDFHTFGEVCANSDLVTIDADKPCCFLEFGNVRGKFCAWQVYKVTWRDVDGNIGGTVGSANDVTERIQVGERLYNRLQDFLFRACEHLSPREQKIGKKLCMDFRAYFDRHKYTEGQH